MKCIFCNVDLKYTDVGWLCEELVPIEHLYSEDKLGWFLTIFDDRLFYEIGYWNPMPSQVKEYFYIRNNLKRFEIAQFEKNQAVNILNKYNNLKSFA